MTIMAMMMTMMMMIVMIVIVMIVMKVLMLMTMKNHHVMAQQLLTIPALALIRSHEEPHHS